MTLEKDVETMEMKVKDVGAQWKEEGAKGDLKRVRRKEKKEEEKEEDEGKTHILWHFLVANTFISLMTLTLDG